MKTLPRLCLLLFAALVYSANSGAAPQTNSVAEATNILWSVVGHPGIVTAVVFSPDGRTLATASAVGQTKLWSLAGGGLPRVLNTAPRIVFSPDGTLLASVGGGGPSAQFLNVGSG